MVCENIEFVVIVFQNISKKLFYVHNYKIILNNQTKKKAIIKYYIFFIKKTIMKTINVKSNCTVKIKIMNKIQCIKIHENYNC